MLNDLREHEPPAGSEEKMESELSLPLPLSMMIIDLKLEILIISLARAGMGGKGWRNKNAEEARVRPGRLGIAGAGQPRLPGQSQEPPLLAAQGGALCWVRS